MVETLRKDDFLLTYWEAGWDNFAWLVDRADQYVFFAVFNGNRLVMRNWHGQKSDNDVVRHIAAAMGFNEVPVHALVRQCKDSIGDLVGAITDFENKRAAAIEENKRKQLEALQQKQENIEGSENADTDRGSEVNEESKETVTA